MLGILRRHVSQAVAALGAKSPAELTAEAVERHLCGLLSPSSAHAVPERPSFTLAELKGILGRTESTVRRAVQRHALPVDATKPKRRLYPRETALFLAGLQSGSRGLSAVSVARRAQSLRRFGKYLRKCCGWHDNPLEDIGVRGEPGGSGRRRRRPLTVAEV